MLNASWGADNELTDVFSERIHEEVWSYILALYPKALTYKRLWQVFWLVSSTEAFPFGCEQWHLFPQIFYEIYSSGSAQDLHLIPSLSVVMSDTKNNAKVIVFKIQNEEWGKITKKYLLMGMFLLCVGFPMVISSFHSFRRVGSWYEKVL